MTQEEASRRLIVEIRLSRHGHIVGGATPNLVPIEVMEEFANKLDELFPEKAWDPVKGPWENQR